MMANWILILVGGLLGSGHCVGMCGGFALALGSNRRRWGANLVRQLAYHAGRVFTYAAAGAVAGFAGLRLGAALPALTWLQAGFAVLAGALLIYYGLVAAGIGRRPRVGPGAACPGASTLAALLRAPHLPQVFVAGLLNGLLPCGLVYAYLALAVSSGSLFHGAATMLLFGLGTIPALLLVGWGGNLLSLALRQHLIRAAAWCVVVTGVLSILRGLGVVPIPGVLSPVGCPLCSG